MSEREQLAAAVAALVPVDEREATSIAATLDRLTWPGDLYDEAVTTHHLTASSFVVSRRGVILHRHRRLGIWVQPGGHVDAGESPPQAALRETREETGLAVHLYEPVTLFHVDVHPGPRGHTHYDLRYLVVGEPTDPAPGAEESQDVFWFDFASALERCEPALAPALRALEEWTIEHGVADW